MSSSDSSSRSSVGPGAHCNTMNAPLSPLLPAQQTPAPASLQEILACSKKARGPQWLVHALSERHARQSHQLSPGTDLLDIAPIPPAPVLGVTPRGAANPWMRTLHWGHPGNGSTGGAGSVAWFLLPATVHPAPLGLQVQEGQGTSSQGKPVRFGKGLGSINTACGTPEGGKTALPAVCP